MNRAFICRIAQIVHLVALSIWLGAVAMSGVVAAIVFPLMREVEPTLGAYADYGGDHSVLAGGLVASRVFFAVDFIQFVCGSLALLTIAIMMASGYSLNTVARVFRVIVLCTTLALLSYHLVIFMPKLQQILSAYWSLAQMGDTAQADAFKDRFLASHAAASRILGTLTIAVLINLILAGWTLTASKKDSTT
jgi:hypothetical protein